MIPPHQSVRTVDGGDPNIILRISKQLNYQRSTQTISGRVDTQGPPVLYARKAVGSRKSVDAVVTTDPPLTVARSHGNLLGEPAEFEGRAGGKRGKAVAFETGEAHVIGIGRGAEQVKFRAFED